jgi:hypothetical protein
MIRGYNFVIYNGITLEVVKLVSHKREAVYDKAKLNYMYTRNTLIVRAILAPTVSEHQLGNRVRPDTSNLTQTPYAGPVSINQGNMANAVVGADPITGLESSNAIKQALLAPRKRLAYVVGGNYVIDSPHQGQACDVTFGPIPLFCHVEKIAGMGTVSILFGIQTDLNQCPLFEGDDQCGRFPWVLSHEYSQQVEIDEQFRTRRTTRGEIRVRADKMASKPCTPDAFREYFAQSCPAHYKRDSIRIVQHPDMTRLEYVIVDVEKERPIINGFDVSIQYETAEFDAAGNPTVTPKRIDLKDAISRVAMLKVTHRVGSTRKFENYNEFFAKPNPGRFAPGGDPNKAAIDRERDLVAPTLWDRWARDFGRFLDRDGLDGELARLRFGTPMVSEAVVIELFGNPASSRYELELVGWYVLVMRMPTVISVTDTTFRDSFYAGGNISFDITHDVMANYVKMEYQYTRATPASFGMGAALSDNGSYMFGPMISGDNSIVGPDIIPGITLHPYRDDISDAPEFNTPAYTLDDNVHNPWGRPKEYMHGTDAMPVRVVNIHDQCEIPPGHESDVPYREDNLDAGGCVMTRQPEVFAFNTGPVEDTGVPDGEPVAEQDAKPQCEPSPGFYLVNGSWAFYNDKPQGATDGPRKAAP